MYTRIISPCNHTFFLFGPRGTGKTTWLKKEYSRSNLINLLLNDVFYQYHKNPSLLREYVLTLNNKEFIIIDEVQKVPALLDEVHNLIEDGKYKFILTGSSARKLKKDGANLLGGRALIKKMFPLVYQEWKSKHKLNEVLTYGSIPLILDKADNVHSYLEAYVGTYLREEIKEEGLVRGLDSFNRFLEIAAIMNGEILNISNISRDAGVERPTATNYFEILIDTLIASTLPSWSGKVRVKEVLHPKFYFFDCGVVRCLQNRHRDSLSDLEIGKLFETYMFHELSSFISYKDIGGKLYYWRTTDGVEVDFIWELGGRRVGIEIKSSKKWKSEFDFGIKTLRDNSKKKFNAFCGVYLGDINLRKEWGTVFTFPNFIQELYKGNILK